MAAQVQTGMEKADMRKMLMHTKEAPVHCAIGLGKDVSVGLLVMDKLKQPKMLEKQLIDNLPDAKNTRFGRAEVDWNEDPKLVKLFLNRPVSGMARKLVKTLKGTGFSKVQIMTEDGTPVEGAADEEDQAEAQQPAAAAAAPAGAPAGVAPGAPPPPPPPPPQAEQAPAADPAELSRRLAALIPRIAQVAGGDEARKAELSKLASLSNVNIKTNNLAYAANYIGQLEKALGGPAPSGNGAAPPPPPPAPPAPPTEAKPNADDLAKQLAALIGRIPAAAGDDPARRAALMKFATDANVNIKTGNPTYAAVAIEQLRRAIEAAGTPATAPAAPAMDAEAMRNFLLRLTLRMPEAAGHNDAKLTQWQSMGAEVGKLLDAGDMAGASAALGRLREAMAADMQKAQEAAKQAKTYDKSGQIWAATRQKVQGELGRLRAAILDSYKGEAFAGEIGAKFDSRTAPVLGTLDLRLADKLAEVGKAADPKQVSALSDQAHALIEDYRKFAGDPLLAELDANPFLPVAVQATVMGTLSQLEKALP